jgi:hypothetical protein
MKKIELLIIVTLFYGCSEKSVLDKVGNYIDKG